MVSERSLCSNVAGRLERKRLQSKGQFVTTFVVIKQETLFHFTIVTVLIGRSGKNKEIWEAGWKVLLNLLPCFIRHYVNLRKCFILTARFCDLMNQRNKKLKNILQFSICINFAVPFVSFHTYFIIAQNQLFLHLGNYYSLNKLLINGFMVSLKQNE